MKRLKRADLQRSKVSYRQIWRAVALTWLYLDPVRLPRSQRGHGLMVQMSHLQASLTDDRLTRHAECAQYVALIQ